MNAITLDTLAAESLWVVWRNESRNGRTTKVPLDPEGTGQMARAGDPRTWGMRIRAERAFTRLVNGAGGGIGIEFAPIGEGQHLGGIDLDACRDPETGEIAPWAQEVIERLGSYTEVSPSGTGAKIYFAYNLADRDALRVAMGTDHGKLWQRGGGEHPPAIELHIGNRYFAVTGQRLDGTPETIETVPAATLLWLVNEAGPKFKGTPNKQQKAAANRTPGGSNILARAHRAAGRVIDRLDGYGSRSEAAMALGSALKAAGWSFDDMVQALGAHPATADWAAEKGDAAGQRELRRIWDRSTGADGEAAEWPTPDLSLIRQEANEAPPVPDNILPSSWAQWTRDAAEGAGAPQAFVFVALLSAAGSILGNARWASPWHPWKEPPAINAALVGRPSSGKSPALDQVQELIVALETEANADWPERQREHKRESLEAAERLKIYEAEVKEAVKGKTAAPEMAEDCVAPRPLQRRRMLSTEPTIEKAARLSEGNPRGLLLARDELAGWIAGMDRYANNTGGERAFWLQAYGGRLWTADRVKDLEPVVIPHLLWSIIGTIQPDRVASLLMSGDDDGLAARFIYCWPAALPPRRPSCRADTDAALDRFRRLRSIHWESDPEPTVLPFTGSAAAALHEWRVEVAGMEAEAAGLMLSWLGKLPGMAVRIALILEMLAWSEREDGAGEPEAIGERATVAAITFLADFAIPMARRTFGAAALPQVERDARRLARWLTQQRPIPEVVNARTLRHRGDGPGVPDAGRMEAALSELAAAGWVRPAPSRDGGPGRARKDWAVNPALEGVES